MSCDFTATLTATASVTGSDALNSMTASPPRPAAIARLMWTKTMSDELSTTIDRGPGPFSQLVEREWQDLLDKSDRTSPAEYPDMCLVTHNEIAGVMTEAWLLGREQAARNEGRTQPAASGQGDREQIKKAIRQASVRWMDCRDTASADQVLGEAADAILALSPPLPQGETPAQPSGLRLGSTSICEPREVEASNLDERLKAAVAWFNALPAEEQEAHIKAQRESYVRSELAWGDEGTRVQTAHTGGGQPSPTGEHHTSPNVALREALEACIGPLEYAYKHVSSVTADRVKNEVLPRARAALSASPAGGVGSSGQ